MPFDIGSTVNAAADWLCGSALVKGIANNAIFTALLLTTIVVVIILGMYYREFRSGGKKKMIRMTIYLLFFVTAVVFVHHYAVERCIRSDAAQKGLRDVFQGIEQSRQINPTSVSVNAPSALIMGGDEEPTQLPIMEVPAHVQGPPSKAVVVPAGTRPDNVAVAADDVQALAGELQIEDVTV